MSRISAHLSSLGVLVLAIAAAAVAYTVYDNPSASPAGESPERVVEVADDSRATPLPPVSDSAGRGETAVAGVEDASFQGAPAGAATPVAVADDGQFAVADGGPDDFGTPVSDPLPADDPVVRSPDRHEPFLVGEPNFGEDRVDRELQRLIDAPPLGPTPVALPGPGLVVPSTPSAERPGPAAPGTATNPPASACPDPDAGLDDTAVGGLDQSDLGGPVDETGAPDPVTCAPPPTTPPPGEGCADPDADLDDTAAGGLDQTGLGGPIDETGEPDPDTCATAADDSEGDPANPADPPAEPGEEDAEPGEDVAPGEEDAEPGEDVAPGEEDADAGEEEPDAGVGDADTGEEPAAGVGDADTGEPADVGVGDTGAEPDAGEAADAAEPTDAGEDVDAPEPADAVAPVADVEPVEIVEEAPPAPTEPEIAADVATDVPADPAPEPAIAPEAG